MDSWSSNLLGKLKERNRLSFSPRLLEENIAISRINKKFITVEGILMANRYDPSVEKTLVNDFVWEEANKLIDGVVIGKKASMRVEQSEDLIVLPFAAFFVDSYCDGFAHYHDVAHLLRTVIDSPVQKGIALFVETFFGHIGLIPLHTGKIDSDTKLFAVDDKGEMMAFFDVDMNVFYSDDVPSFDEFAKLHRLALKGLPLKSVVRRNLPGIALFMKEVA